MSNNKITLGQRDLLVADIISHRFDDEQILLSAEIHRISLAAYNECFTAKELALMKTLPTGWLESSSVIRVQFGNSQGYVQLILPHHMPLPYCCKYGCIKVFDKDDPLSIRYHKYNEDLKAHKEARAAGKREILAMISSVNTWPQLRAAWPEIASFIDDHEPRQGKPQLPAVQLQTLNSLLNLPPEKKAVTS